MNVDIPHEIRYQQVYREGSWQIVEIVPAVTEVNHDSQDPVVVESTDASSVTVSTVDNKGNSETVAAPRIRPRRERRHRR